MGSQWHNANRLPSNGRRGRRVWPRGVDGVGNLFCTLLDRVRGCAWLLLVWLGFTTVLWAADSDAQEEGFVSEVWQVADGLPDNGVTSVAQTLDGYLWVGTRGGLARFDGVRFEVFKSSTPGLGDRSIGRVFVDAEGVLWVSMKSGLLARYVKGRFVPCGTAEGWSMKPVAAFGLTSRHEPWMVDESGQVFRYEEGRFERLSGPESASSLKLRSWTMDRAGNAWALDELRHLYQWQGAGWEPMAEVGGGASGRVMKTSVVRDGGLRVVEDVAIRRIADGLWANEFTEIPVSTDFLSAVTEDSQGNLWLGTSDSKLYCVALRQPVVSFRSQEGLPTGAVSEVSEDREGNLWIASDGGGLIRLKRAVFRSYGIPEGLPAQPILSIAEEVPGRLVVGTHGGGMYVFEGGRFFGPVAMLGRTASVAALLPAREGGIWVGTEGAGLLRLHGMKSAQWTTPQGLAHPSVLALCEDRSGGLWLGGPAGLSRFDGTRFTHYTKSDGLIDNAVRAVAEDSDGALWVGTLRGLSCFKQGKFSSWSRVDGLGSDQIVAVLPGAGGVVWIGTTDGGLSRLKDGRFVNFSTRQGLPEDSVSTLIEDGQGNLWMGMGRGVCRVAVSELEAVAEGRQSIVECVHFLARDGFAPFPASIGSSSGFRSAGGELWFATSHALSGVSPSRMPRNSVPPPVAVEEVTVDGEVIYSNRRADGTEAGARTAAPVLRIPAGKRHIEIAYAAPTLTSPTQTRFRIEMGEKSGVGRDVGNRRVAFYDGLAAGRYQFRVMAVNRDGVWSREPAVVGFVLAPYVWETWWFRGGGVCAVFAAGWILLRRRIELRERMRVAETLRVQAAALAESEERFRTLALATLEAVIIYDELKILEANPAAMKLFVRKEAELIGGSISDLMDWGDREKAEMHFRSKSEATKEYRGIRSDGVSFDLEVHCRRFPYRGRPMQVAAMRDVTEARQAQQRIQSLVQQRALEMERSRIARDMHDEMGSSLTRITLLSEAAELGMESGDASERADARSRLQRISTLGRSLVTSMDEIVWAVNPGNDSLEECASYLCHFAPDLLRTAGIQCRLIVPEVLPSRIVSSELRHNLFLVVKEALHNIVKHSGASVVTLSMSMRGDALWIQIVDDGRGFDPAGREGTGNGLANMRERMREARAELDLWSEPGKGARLTVLVPIAPAAE